MAKALLIAEKPDLKRKVQEAYRKFGHKDTIDFESFIGHTMKLKDPVEYNPDWKSWRQDVLPMIPDKFEYKPSPDKVKLYNELKNKIKKGGYDYLINCCDPGREGQSIFFTFYETIGCKLPVKRMWHNDVTDKELSRALNNLRDEKEPSLMNMTEASKLRGYFDWALGMNLTRAFTLVSGSSTPLNLGRVMTPTLKMIVDRELEIRNFKPVNFYEIEGDFGVYKGIYFDKDNDNETRFLDKAKAEAKIKSLGKVGFIESIEEKREKNYAPNLHCLSDLQKEANKVFGYTAIQTLNLAQKLYDSKILSYPRTDSKYLTKGTAIDSDKGFLKMLTNTVSSIPELEPFAKEILKDKKSIIDMADNKKYVDDKKVSDHYAIVPTGDKVNFNSLSKDEQNILVLVCKRLLAIFMKPVILNKSSIITNVDGDKFKTSGSILLEKGYSVLYGTSFVNNVLPKVSKGDKVNVNGAKLIEKTTTPPSRYTDSSILDAMVKSGRFVDDKKLKEVLKESSGIGTEATRGAIIEKLVTINMMERKKKNLVPTELGISIIQSLGNDKIGSPELTGEWENKLREIEKGNLSPKVFYKDMIKFVEEETNLMLSRKVSVVNSKDSLGVCPKCKKPIKEGKNYYLCTGYKKDCDFVIGKTILGAKITKTEVKKILKGEPTKELSFSKGTGSEVKTWKSKLIYNNATNRLEFFKEDNSNLSTMLCPCCKEKIKITEKYYVCSKYKNSCDFVLLRKFNNANISENDLKELLQGKTIKKKFTWKSGKQSEAGLRIENGKYKLEF